jgi:hypothetical protein
MGCPCNEVDRGSVESDLIYLLPAVGLFAPDEDLAVVRGRSEDIAVLGVCPCYAPDSTFVSANMLAYSSGDAIGAQAPNCFLAPSCLAMTYPLSVSTNVCLSPSTSKILIVLSEEQVANRLP